MTRKTLKLLHDAAPVFVPLLLALSAAICAVELLNQAALAQNVEGEIIASQYGQWQLQGTQTNSFVFSPAACQVKGGNRNFSALKQSTPIRIVDPGNSALDETVIAGLVNIHACSVQLSPVNVHNPPFYLTSGTAGLQEAIDANQTANGANSIILSADWYKEGGSAAIIGSVTGIPALGLVDITTTPYTWYRWNGSQYAVVPIGGGGSPGGASGAFQYNAGGTFAGSLINGLVKGNGTSAPSAAVAGRDYQPPTSFTCSGGITCPQVGNAYSFTSSGEAGSGNVSAQNLYADGSYQTAGATIGSQGNSSTVPDGLSGSQMQAAVNAQGTLSVLHINGPEQPFTNSSNIQVQDNRRGTHPYDVTSLGSACDAQLTFATTTAESNVISLVGGGYYFTATDADVTTPKWISIVGLVSGVPTRFDAFITAMNSSGQATLSAAVPFSATAYSMTIGHDDTAALANAEAIAENGNGTLQLPGTNPCWTRTAPLALSGAPLLGQIHGGLLGGAGLDVTTGATSLMENVTGYVDARIDATKPWNWDNNGTTTAQAPLYRPVGQMTPSANNPLGPGWVRGSEPYGLYAFNGVATTTAGSASMCVLTPTIPPVGADIVFPQYGGGAVVHTTVSTIGSACTGGTTVTLASGIGMTAVTQNEFFYGEAPGSAASGTAVQEIATAIPATGRTFPMTVNLGNPNNPEPSAESDFAPFGLVKIDSEECQYYQTSSYPMAGGQWIKLTSCANNGTTAAAHAVGAAIVPLNAFQPTLPWPVTTINGAGNQTPPNAEYFPAFNIGNAFIAQPVPDGTGFGGPGGFSESQVKENTINVWPVVVYPGANENPYNFQATNSTAGMYMVPLPFNSWFTHNNISGPQFGIWEGVAATHNHDYIGVPTSDTDVFDSNHVNAGYAVGLVGGGTLGFTNNQLFSQNGPPNSGWYPFTPAVGTGGAVCLYMSAYGPDDTVGLGQGQYTQGSEIFDATISGNTYCEAENPDDGASLADTQPIAVLDFSSTTWTGASDMNGGAIYLGGTANTIIGGIAAGGGFGTTTPLIINGSFEDISFSQLGSQSISNVWGQSTVLNWGVEDCVSGFSNNGDSRQSYGSCKAKQPGQTQDFALYGNIANPFANMQSGWFPADVWTPAPQAGTSIFRQFDGSRGNLTQEFTGCQVASGIRTVQCTVFLNGINSNQPEFGLGQPLPQTKYLVTIGVRECNAYPCTDSPQTFGMIFGSSAGYVDQTHTAIPVTTTWTNVPLGVVDLTSVPANSAFEFWINGTSAAATNLEFSYISLVPLPANFTASQFSQANGATWTSGSTAPSGTCTSGSLYTNTSGTPNTLYVCQSGLWVAK